jgi:flagellar protein FliS
MSSMTYQQKALDGATGIELVVALYDGAVRFLYRAIQCIEEDDVRGRRLAVKKAIDVLMYLQARLRPELGSRPAVALSDFYAAMFTMTLEASHAASKEQFLEVIACIRNVREAWAIAAKDPAAGRVLPRELRTQEERFTPAKSAPEPYDGEAVGSRWQA